eukprot:CAMPEP_0174702606 /NCGR_PEP_ID=MMETSP1094-20130205/6829_1 /TAXON_ID=156173 /ORGANISM="Chrysochromulina brevifilum, Strain UTEX LB 985" /LENGTH=215 /DNA_ID=CAMNT_0015900397 /DNA_START=187 /DNA_END=833 /DNA_ORIENTATION=-
MAMTTCTRTWPRFHARAHGSDFMHIHMSGSSSMSNMARTSSRGASTTPSALRRAASPSASISDVNARSWRFEKCSELAYLQDVPPNPQANPPLRSRRLTLNTLLTQCDYIFGSGTHHLLLGRNSAIRERFGGAQPATGTSPASQIFYLDFSDDPWAEASVRKQTAPTLPYCLTTCDGCGHCGAGVPPTLSECFDRSDRFVDGVLAGVGGAQYNSS